MGFIDNFKRSGELFGNANNGVTSVGGASGENLEVQEIQVAPEGEAPVVENGEDFVRAGTFEEKPEPGSFAFTDAETQAAAAEETHAEVAQSFGLAYSAATSESANAETNFNEETTYRTDDKLTNSHISEDTEIIGDINSKGNIEIRGKVMGDVATQGNVIVEGGIFGNVSGQNIGLYTCKIKGDVQAAVDVMGDSGTVVMGNINANNIVMDGKCKGVVNADNMLVIRGNSYLIGDITARSFVVDDGAVINGSIKTITNENLDALFNITDGDMDL
ncbi:MAG: polymer-forming cytoskeletal protein [Clostridiales Family XIII bacterium]|jgi:cytoskeletal protein CcmA (bactofilin family)|nr:polymer-forming cytoskeletal protein [Clostridiales Family XIII bacterium]